jgi:2-octaprenyl-6-methoxyphenol hydroxylase
LAPLPERLEIDVAADYDVLISGGGMVGASLAVALSSLPLRVALTEAVPFDSAAQPSFDERTTALSLGSHRILDALGVWRALAERACPIRRIHVSERGRLGNAVITAEGQGVSELGFVVANRSLGAALWGGLSPTPRLDVFCPGRVLGIQQHPGHVRADLHTGAQVRSITTRLLVVAEGAESPLREALGIGVSRRSYEQTAIVGNAEIEQAFAADTAWERFTADGPIALLPFGERRFVFVIARHSQVAGELLVLDEPKFIAVLQDAFGQRLGKFIHVGRRASYELSLVRASHVTAPRAVLVGNAAHGLHPIAGQGYNLGLRDVAALAELIADLSIHAGDQADVGSADLLRQYAAWRHRDQRNVVAFTDGLIRTFGLPLDTVGRARGLGLMLFDIAPGAKRALARHTMGLGGKLTRLARGLPL